MYTYIVFQRCWELKLNLNVLLVRFKNLRERAENSQRGEKSLPLRSVTLMWSNCQDGFPEPVRNINQEKSKYQYGLIKSQLQLTKNRYSLMMWWSDLFKLSCLYTVNRLKSFVVIAESDVTQGCHPQCFYGQAES